MEKKSPSNVKKVIERMDNGWEPTVIQIADYLYKANTFREKSLVTAVMGAVRKRYLKQGKILYNDSISTGKGEKRPGVYSLRDLDDESINFIYKKGNAVKTNFSYLHKIQKMLTNGELRSSSKDATREVKKTLLLCQKFLLEDDLKSLEIQT